MTRAKRDFLLEVGGHLVAFFLPLYFNPFSTRPVEAVKVSLFQGITGGMVVVALLSLTNKRGLDKYSTSTKARVRTKLTEYSLNNPLLLPALAYGGVYVLATLTSVDPWISFWGLATRPGTITTLGIVVYFILVSSVLKTTTQVERVITSLLLGSVPVSIYGWIQHLGLDPLQWKTTSVSLVHSTVGYSLYLGAYLSMVIPLTLSRLLGGREGERRRLLPYILVLVLQVTCLLFTLSRGAWLGLIGGCLVFIRLLRYRWRWRVSLVAAAVVLVIGSSLFITLSMGLVAPLIGNPERLAGLPLVELRSISDSQRLILWKHTLPLLTQRYWLGYGPETFEIALQRYYPPDTFQELEKIQSWDPHNLILYLVTSIGILGLVAFLWVLYRFYKVSLSVFGSGVDQQVIFLASALIGSATAFLIQAQFNPSGIVPVTLFWLVLALGVSINRREGADRPVVGAVQ